MSQRFRTTAQASLRDRSTLLGVPDYYTPPSSGRSSPYGGQSQFQPGGHRFADDLEGQNDEQLDGLTAKVKMLKEVSELTYHTRRPCESTYADIFHI
ncbi:hypothetical protein AcW1_000393 [Taiwanofungus camphoratus]|nr:hypothetical protein AcV5_004295 [Antrodia cinnamomea]KAI0963268.1 hypothetical protein AcW1_000393 [Antrodia cinnamomea]